MSFKQYVPHTSQDWDTYWKQTSIAKELDIVKTDGLQPIFDKYLTKNGIHLEAGCGLGKWLIDLSQNGFNTIGLDTYVNGLLKLKHYNNKLQLQASNVTQLALKNNSIDTYISLGVIEHFEDGPHQALSEAFRTTKPAGIAIIEVPFDSPLRIFSRKLFAIKVAIKFPLRFFLRITGLRKARIQPTMKFYEYRYSKKELYSFVAESGFKLIEILPKDDLSPNKCITLWSDFIWARHADNKLFHLNVIGAILKKLLHTISPFSYPALIVAVATKPDK